MRKSMIAILLAGTVSLSACATSSEQAGDIAQGAAIGATGGVVAGAVIPGVSVIEGAAIVCHELRLQQQILRRVAGDRQFREGNKIWLGLAGFTQPAGDSSHIAVQIPDGGIHLNHGNPKGTHR